MFYIGQAEQICILILKKSYFSISCKLLSEERETLLYFYLEEKWHAVPSLLFRKRWREGHCVWRAFSSGVQEALMLRVERSTRSRTETFWIIPCILAHGFVPYFKMAGAFFSSRGSSCLKSTHLKILTSQKYRSGFHEHNSSACECFFIQTVF